MYNSKFSLTDEPIDILKATEFCFKESFGSNHIFIGTVRDKNKNIDKQVVALEFEAYLPMCHALFNEYMQESLLKWQNPFSLYVIHRNGLVKVGEICFLVACSTSHRPHSSMIVDDVTEFVKSSLPVWKKEIYQDESSYWIVNKECFWLPK